MKRTSIAAVAVAASVLAPSLALAQGNTQQNPMDQRVEQHIQQMRSELQITPQEQPEWHSFAQTMWQNAHEMNQILQRRAANLQTMNAAEDMQSYAQLAEVHAQNMQRMSAAFDQLYGVMSPQQRDHATQLFRQRAEQFGKQAQNRQG
jgi:hypothetical protein